MNRTLNRILLADDDVELCEMLKQLLEAEDFQITMVHDGTSALEMSRNHHFDLMVLDVMMPGLNGFDVLRALRKSSTLPVLMLTARGDDIDSIVGLELGADDYLPKPCNARVLVARINTILRRSHLPDNTTFKKDTKTTITLEDLIIQTGSRNVLLDNSPIIMTSTEYSILEVLAQNAGKVVTKAKLCEQALGRELTQYDRSIDMHMSSLRKKLGNLKDGNERIKTVRGVGYQYIQD